MFPLRKAQFLVAGILLLLIATGCGGGSNSSGSGSSGSGGSSGGGSQGSGGSTAPAITQFAVTPSIAAGGQLVNFSWATANATAFTVTPSILLEDTTSLAVNNTKYAWGAPNATTTYQAQATGVAGTAPAAASVKLTVVPVLLSASAMQIPAGQYVMLTYSGPNNGSQYVLTTLPANTQTTLSPGCSGTTCNGTQMVGPLGTNVSYTVTANGPVGGQSVSPTVNITVTGALTVTLSANPQTVPSGGASTLSWTTQNAVSLSITATGNQTVCNPCMPRNMGTAGVNPTQTTTYTATATDAYGNQIPASAIVTVSTGGVSNLKHIIFMVQENRAFDNYFGVLAQYRVSHQPPIQGAQLSDVNDLHTLPPGYTIKNPAGNSYAPYHQRTECIENLSPSWDETHYDMDLVGNDWLNLTQSSQYLMDRFLDTTLSGGSGDQYDPNHTRPLGYYDQTDLPFYYELATQFATDDNWYSPIPANTIPNRMYLFAATSYGHGYPVSDPNDPVWQRPTIFRALQNAGITWRYYYQDNSVFLANWADWNDPQIQGNVRNISEYRNILASSTADQDLPQVVFIERASATGYDEHPDNNIQEGAASVQQIITELLNSLAWSDSVFILTFDEGGGLFDHVGPILATPPDDILPVDLQGHTQGLFNVTGFRVPVIVVSPWVKPQYVSHLQTDYTAMLKLIETRFGVPNLTQRDLNAGDMTDPNSGFFDFSSPHLLTVPPLPTQPTDGTCNQQLEGSP
ncbi:MAG: alkaline phosphatase family protein [Candidatus Korobacteraceae bacterium]